MPVHVYIPSLHTAWCRAIMIDMCVIFHMALNMQNNSAPYGTTLDVSMTKLLSPKALFQWSTSFEFYHCYASLYYHSGDSIITK